MVSYDLIIVSQSVGDLIAMTQRAIDSCIAETKVNVILIETSADDVRYKGVDKYIQYTGEFNYNRALNMGLSEAKGDIHILANNDIIFHPGWSRIGEQMRNMGYLSACCLSEDSRQQQFERGDHCYEGYEIGSYLTGWCIFIDSRLKNIIGKMDETYNFWYSDDAYADQLKRTGVKHALFCNCQVDHHTSVTLSRQSSAMKRKYTLGDIHKRRRDAKREKMYAGNSKAL